MLKTSVNARPHCHLTSFFQRTPANSGVARLLKVGGQRCRRRRRRIRDTEGVEWRDAEGIEGVGNGEGVSPSPAD